MLGRLVAQNPYPLDMNCAEIQAPMRHLLDTLADLREAPAITLDPKTISVALSYGWVYVHNGRVALTGAGAYHTRRERGRGLLE